MRPSALAVLLVAASLCGCGEKAAATWHSYTDPQGVPHRSLHLADYKKGLFFGSCGPSTLSLQWEYRLDLAGPGPNWVASMIKLQNGDLKPVPVAPGSSVSVAPDERSAFFSLFVSSASKAVPFGHNGTFPLTKED